MASECVQCPMILRLFHRSAECSWYGSLQLEELLTALLRKRWKDKSPLASQKCGLGLRQPKATVSMKRINANHKVLNLSQLEARMAEWRAQGRFTAKYYPS